MNQLQRNLLIRQNSDQIEKESASGTLYEAKVRSFYYGNQYYLFVNQVFKDIRLVGTPPASIGKFGGDTDNWMWPRHTGDFSVFRIYANASNEPASYSIDNVPYKPKKFLPISLKGYEKDDFTFVFGYPGTTREYLPSSGVNFIANQENPLRVSLRQKRLDIMNAAMNESREVRIQYTAKANGVANYWKKMIGESRGIQRINAIEKKEIQERDFLAWTNLNDQRKAKYGLLPAAFSSTYQEFLPVNLSSVYISEAALGIEVVRFASGFRELSKISKEKGADPDKINKSVENLRRISRDFYKNWNRSIDQSVMAIMLQEMSENMNPAYQPDILPEIASGYKHDFGKYAQEVFSTSIFTDSSRLSSFLRDYKASKYKKLDSDPIFRLVNRVFVAYDGAILPSVARFNTRIDSLQRLYMAGLMEMQTDKVFYPDANGTLRIAFGKVDDYQPADAVHYKHFTTLAGVMQKEDSTIYDYKVDPELKKLYMQKDFGRYADRDGSVHVAFTASNHTTGGNSGSPVLNRDGEIIGINFDRNWEGTLSDLMYDPSQCRNIAIDIRYCLFVIDKVYGNSHLIDELTIVN
jgi:hypothetical protein